MNRRQLTFVSILLTVFGSLYSYLMLVVVRPLQLKPEAAWLLYLISAIPFTLFIWVPLIYWNKDTQDSKLEKTLADIAFQTLGFVLLLFFVCVTRDLVVFFSSLFTDSLSWLYSSFATFGLILLSCMLTLVGRFEAFKTPRIKPTKVPVTDEHFFLKNFNIAQISDLHIGRGLPLSFVKRVVEKTNSVQPDVIALTGDIGDANPEDHEAELTELAKLKSKIGIYYVPGNHEYYWNVHAWMDAFEKLGFKVLINRNEILSIKQGKLMIAGVPDASAGASVPGHLCSPKQAIIATAGDEDQTYKILLSHQPQVAEAAALAGFDLQLSGHTHGGQFFPFNWIVNFVHRYPRGLHRVKQMHLYVSQGTGFWGPPVRLGASSEISLISFK